MINMIRRYMGTNKTLINIFLVYFFLTFVIGYLDFDRRVYTFEQSTDELRKVVEGPANPPLSNRLLIPYAVYYFSKISHISLSYSFALFRFLFFFLAFALFHIYLRKWFDDKICMIGTLSLIASLPLFMTNWYSIPTDMPELITFILGAMFIINNKYKFLFILIPLATLNRETTIMLILLYFLNGLGREKPRLLIKRSAVCFALWLIPFLWLWKLFGQRPYPGLDVLKHNVSGLLSVLSTPNPYNHYFFLFYLCGFYWILAFKDFKKKDIFLRRSLIVILLHFLYGFFRVAAINEARIFIIYYVFIIPLGLFSLFNEQKVIKENE